MIVAVHQPQYLPWLGYFDKILRADIFVLLDNVQFKKNEWQNRNRIKTAQGPQWLTVPVGYKYPQLIKEVAINNTVRWQHKQRQAILTNYRKAACHEYLEEFFEEVFSNPWQMISELNTHVVRRLVEILGIETPLFVASELGVFPDNPDKIEPALDEAENYLRTESLPYAFILKKGMIEPFELKIKISSRTCAGVTPQGKFTVSETERMPRREAVKIIREAVNRE